MEPGPKTPLVWDRKAAVGCLALLSLMQLHEAGLYFFGKRGIFTQGFEFAPPLALFAILGWGLIVRNSIAWWAGLLVMGAIAIFHATRIWPALMISFGFGSGVPSGSSTHWRLWYTPFEISWLVVEGVLLSAVPILLLVERFSKSPTSDRDP